MILANPVTSLADGNVLHFADSYNAQFFTRLVLPGIFWDSRPQNPSKVSHRTVSQIPPPVEQGGVELWDILTACGTSQKVFGTFIGTWDATTTRNI